MNNFSLLAATMRHFLPIVEKDDTDGTIAQNYREALSVMEHIAELQLALREVRRIKISRPELTELTEGLL